MSVILNDVNVVKVRLIDFDSVNHGVVDLDVAIKKAELVNLDLMQVSDGEIPTCIILDYSKYKYEQKKKKKKNRKPKLEMKELQFRPNTDIADITRLINNAQKFIDTGHPVKFNVRFKGREIGYTDNVLKSFELIIKSLKIPSIFTISHDLVVNNRRMVLYVKRGK